MPQLFPANPSASMVIRNVTPNIITMSLPFARFGIVRFGARGTLVKLATGSLAIFSPVSMTPEVREVVQAQGGNVKYIIAPDMEHHLHITAWKNAFPEAAILAPEGLWEKRQKNSEYNDAPFQYVFKKEGSPPTISEEFDAEFDIEYVHAHGNQQYSKTKDGSTANFLTRLFLPAMSVGNPPTGQRRFIWYLATTDRGAFQQSIRRIIRWDFDRLIPCHGDVIETGAKEVFQNVFAWFLQEDHEHV
ncbi:hypothetical protein N7470_003178 [Penicillium chermesinum]|nr:hypothetical protein N7470_003178 [Penicillium chermesinum]